MVTYSYPKQSCNEATIRFFIIQKEAELGQVLEGYSYEDGVVHLQFASGMSAEQKFTLDDLMSQHGVETLLEHGEWCPVCKFGAAVPAATNCPMCSTPMVSGQSMLHFDHIPIGTETKNGTSAVPVICNRLAIKAGLYPDGVRVNLIVAGNKIGGGAGYVRLYDYTNAKELGTIEFGSDVKVKEVQLVDFPHEGLSVLELQLYTDGVGTVRIYSAVMEVG